MEVARLKRGQKWRYGLGIDMEIGSDGAIALSEAPNGAVEWALGVLTIAYVLQQSGETFFEENREPQLISNKSEVVVFSSEPAMSM